MLFVALLLVAVSALVPIVRARAAIGRGWTSALLALAALTIGVATLAADASTDASTSRPLEVPAEGYVGSASCRSCHPSEHASWHDSFHRTMTQVATRAALQPSFERLELDWFGEPVVLEWRGERLWAEFARGGGRPARVERPVEQLTGAHHLQVLWYSTGEGRELAPVPMCYKVAEARWIPLTSVFVLPPDPQYHQPPDPGAWNRSCSECHTTDARPRFVAGGVDTHVGEFGVACESCHGPGRAHVEANKDPLRRYRQRWRGADETIANPAEMPPARSAETCGHCHSVRIVRGEHFASWAEHGSPFEPGDDLQRTHLVIDLDDRDAPELREELRRNPNFFRSNFWSDGEVRLSGREFSGLRRSPCYTHGDQARQLDCTSCHQLHAERRGEDAAAWRDDQLADGMRGNAACTQCHEAFVAGDALAAHTRHAANSSGSDCMNCHMPHTSIGLMKASRSHAITSPDVGVELRTGRPNACNLCHLDRSLQWTAEQLARGWQVVAPPLSAEERDVAAGVRWILTGDAGLRMLAADAFARPDAQRAAGDDWLAPFLSRLLDDPYYVVRFNAERALRSLGYDGLLARYDFLAAPERAAVFVDNVTDLWQARYRGAPRPAVLLDARGLERARFDRLYARRDDRPVYLAE